MPWTREELQVFLSENLLKENLAAVVHELQEMQAGRGMIAADHDESMLQGDVYADVPWISRVEGNLVASLRRVLLISNSCDVSLDNPRPVPLDLTVAPVLKLASYEKMLLDGGVSTAAVDDTIRAIKRQEKSHIIFLPRGAGLEEDMVALLDKIQSLPHEDFQSGEPARLSVLTQRGFWVLLVKLSMHFLRPHEGVARHAA